VASEERLILAVGPAHRGEPQGLVGCVGVARSAVTTMVNTAPRNQVRQWLLGLRGKAKLRKLTSHTTRCGEAPGPMIELPASIAVHFLAAGWRPGRHVTVAPAVTTDHPAHAILAEFGGLRVGQAGQGEECGTSDLVFQPLRRDGSIRMWGDYLQRHSSASPRLITDTKNYTSIVTAAFLVRALATTRSTSMGRRSEKLWSASSWGGVLNQCSGQTKNA
jgi:SUKH-3 immunity protein